MRRHPLQRRFALWIASLVVVVAVALATLLTQQSETALLLMTGNSIEGMDRGLYLKAREQVIGTTNILAENLVNPLYQLDMLQMRELLSSTRRQAGIEQALVFDPYGKILNDGYEALHGFGKQVDPRSFAALQGVEDAPELYRDGESLVAARAIRIGDQPLGGLEIRFDLSQYHRIRDETADRLRQLSEQAFSSHQRSAVAATLLLLLLALLVALLLARQLARPIQGIARRIDAIGEGDLSSRLPPNPSLELDRLCEAINSMSDKLGATTVRRDYLEGILDSMREGLVVMDSDNRVAVSNPAFRRMLGLPGDRPWQGRLVDLFGSKDRDRFEYWAHAGRHGRSSLLEIDLHTDSGNTLPVSLSCATLGPAEDFLVCVLQDVSERLRDQQHILRLAHYDHLTGLPNRALFFDRLSHALLQCEREQTLIALLYLDIDFFKRINDRLGHASGDELLRQAAARISHAVREGDTVARMGGDEFTIVLEMLHSTQDAERVARDIVESLGKPFVLPNQTVYVSASVGAVFHPFQHLTAEQLVQFADAAMYGAKQAGRGCYRFYDGHQEAGKREELALEEDLQGALHHDQFFLLYQPQYNLHSGSLSGFEALLRWRHPQLGVIAPAVFIPMLEAMGNIDSVGRWVIDRACAMLASLRCGQLRVSVNLAPQQLSDPLLIRHIDQTLARYGLQGHQLELELTESTLIADIEQSEKVLQQLRERQVRVAVDDFGTGYSSLSYLHTLSLNTLKLDQTFVSGLPADDTARTICRTVIRLGQNLELKVIAEGAETPEQLAALRELGADEIQGFLTGAPVAEEALADVPQSLPDDGQASCQVS